MSNRPTHLRLIHGGQPADDGCWSEELLDLGQVAGETSAIAYIRAGAFIDSRRSNRAATARHLIEVDRGLLKADRPPPTIRLVPGLLIVLSVVVAVTCSIFVSTQMAHLADPSLGMPSANEATP